MRLILEGIDGVGKTSILNAINKTHHVKNAHLIKPPKGVTPHKWSDYFRETYDTTELISRSHISEQVYGTLIRGKSLIDDWQAWHLTMQLRIRGFRIAYITREFVAVKTLMASREKPSDYDLWVLQNWDVMEKAYQRYLPKDLTVVVHNNGELQQAVNQAAVAGVHPWETSPLQFRGIGSPQPKVVIVGDEFTLRRRDFPHAKPFDFGEASKMLFEALGQLERVYICNSFYHDLGEIRSQFQLGDELKRLAGAKIIALGNEAATRLKKVGFEPNQIVPHPQYWRRFKYADRGSYVADLKQVAENFHG